MSNSHCKSFCPTCKFYSICVRDTIYSETAESLIHAEWDAQEEVIREKIEQWI